MSIVTAWRATEANRHENEWVNFSLFGRPKLTDQARLGQLPYNHCSCTPSSLGYDIRWLIDEKFRWFSADSDGSIDIGLPAEAVNSIFWCCGPRAGSRIGPQPVATTA